MDDKIKSKGEISVAAYDLIRIFCSLLSKMAKYSFVDLGFSRKLAESYEKKIFSKN